MKLISKIINIIKFTFNLALYVMGYILSPLNLIIILFIKQYKSYHNHYFDVYKSIKFNAYGKLRKILKNMNLHSKDGVVISENDLDNSYFGIFKDIENENSELIVLLIPEYTNNLKTIWTNYKKIKLALELNPQIRIFTNKNIKYMFWVLLFFNKLIKADSYSCFSGVIYLNSQFDKKIDKLMIPSISLLCSRFYCYYTKYISDNFPWINMIKSDDNISKFAEFPEWIDNFGYDEILNKKMVGHDRIKNDDIDLFKNEFLNKFLISKNLIKQTYPNNSSHKIGIIFPIYQNWLYLKCRSLKSLLYNWSFNNIEIYLIEDGSKLSMDSTKYINDNFKDFENIIFYKFGGYGSGSPARPRNMGVKLACKNKCDYICFLDPDNSFINHSLDFMLKDIENTDFNICAYNMWTFGKTVNSKYESENKWGITKQIYTSKNNSNILNHYKFCCFNMQQLIIDAKWLIKNNVEEREKTLGEDMIFWYEIIDKMPNIKFFNKTNSIYFNYQINSLTNKVTEDFFIKSLNCFEYIYAIFSKNNRINDYINSEFYKNYYNGVLAYWKNEFNYQILLNLQNLFLKFDVCKKRGGNPFEERKLFHFSN